MRRIIGALMIILLLPLAACGQRTEEDRTDVLAVYQDFTSIVAKAEVTANYGDYLYTFSVGINARPDSGTLTILTPEIISGSSVSWGEDGTALTYDGYRLELGTMNGSKLSPATAMAELISACRTLEATEVARTTLEGEDVLAVTYETAGDAVYQLWLAPDDCSMRRAEVLQEGNTVITLVFWEFTLT